MVASNTERISGCHSSAWHDLLHATVREGSIDLDGYATWVVDDRRVLYTATADDAT
jgi:hypothetical protein